MMRRSVGMLLLVAPFLGEVLSTATAPLDLLLPWNLALLVALYGGGALGCREVAHRWGLGLRGLALLGAAYGVYEEALVDRFWFDPGFGQDTGVGDYSRVWHTSVLLAVHLTVFHAAVSVCCSVLVVEWLFPGERDRAWVRPWALVVAGVGMLVVLFLKSQDNPWPPAGPVLAAIGVGVVFVGAAFVSRRRVRPARGSSSRRSRPRLLGVVAFVCTGAHFVLVYAVPSTGLVWPVGVLIAVVPLVVGVGWVRCWAVSGPLGVEGFWVVAGVLGFFLVLDALVGLGGRYDLTVAAVFAVVGLARLRRRVGADPPVAGGPVASG
jgi:hypothetical protein